jgi:hypothetical protein
MKFRALIGFLILLVSIPSMAQAVTQKELDKFIPSGYRIVKWVEADINGDKQKDVVVAIEPQKPQYGTPNATQCPKIIGLFRNRNSLNKVWEFSDDGSHVMGRGENSKLQEPLLHIEDINQDGIPEIIFSMAYIGASDAAIATYVFAYRKGNFVELLDGPLTHSLDGGVVIRDLDKSKKGKELMLYYAIWAEDEAHYDPHRYKAEFYAYNPKIQKYYCYKKLETKKKGKAGLRELGLAR